MNGNNEEYRGGLNGFQTKASQLNKKGKLITFFRNGDPHFKPLTVSISAKWFSTLEALLMFLNEKIPTPAGVRYVFNLDSGREVKEVTDLIGGEAYAVSSVRRLNRNVPYGTSTERYWRNKPPSAHKIRRGEQRLFMDGNKYEDPNEVATVSSVQTEPYSRQGGRTTGRASSQQQNGLFNHRQGRAIIIISNTHRESTERVLVNPNSRQNFEDMLLDFTNLLQLSQPPIQTLYTTRPPHRRVCSYSQLFRDFRDVDEFYACGLEFIPLEMKAEKRSAPQSSSTSSGPFDAARVQQPPRRVQPSPRVNDLRRGERMPNKLPRHEDQHQPVGRGHNNDHHNYQPPGPHRAHEPIYEDYDDDVENCLNTDRDYRYEEQLDRSVHKNNRHNPDEIFTEPVLCEIRGKSKAFWPPNIIDHRPPTLPNKTLKLDWIYGYNGNQDSGGLYVLQDGELVYSVGKVVIIFSPSTSKQRHYQEHTSQVTSLAHHPSKLYIVSGQIENPETGAKPCIRIWDSENLTTYCVMGEDCFQSTVVSLDFSKESSGEYLLVLDGPRGPHRQNLFIFDWHNQREMARTKTSRDQVRSARFHLDDDLTIVTLGRRHVHFWRIFWAEEPGGHSRVLRDKKSGIFLDCVPDEVLSVTFDLVGNVVTGDSDGRLHVWVRDDEDAYICRSAGHLQHAHKSGITSLMMIGDGTLLSASENFIRAWDTLSDYSYLKERTLSGSWGNIRTLASSHPEDLDGGLIIGTNRCCILEGSLQDRFQPLLQQHGSGPVCIAAHPSEHAVVTGGEDCMISKWSVLQHKVLWVASIEKPCTCIAYHPHGHLIVAGTNSGRFIVIKDNSGSQAMSCQINTLEQPIGTVKFSPARRYGFLSVNYSPNGEFLALGCEDGNVYIYTVQDQGIVYRKWNEGTLKGHSTPVTALDWAENSKNLRTQSEDYEVKYWDINDMQHQKEGFDLRNINFFTHSCLYSFQVIGIWNSLNYHNINAMSRSSCGDKIAAGDQYGTISLYNYPSHKDTAPSHKVKSHVGNVSTLKFLFDDSYLLSCAGETPCAIIQWSLVEHEE